MKFSNYINPADSSSSSSWAVELDWIGMDHHWQRTVTWLCRLLQFFFLLLDALVGSSKLLQLNGNGIAELVSKGNCGEIEKCNVGGNGAPEKVYDLLIIAVVDE